MRNKQVYIAVLFLCSWRLLAQDPQFTQFYSAPMFLNPAFTGLTYEHRFTLNYRNQWPGVKRAYQTGMAAYDLNVSNINSGIGGFMIYDRAGTSNLVTQQFGFNYAYRIKLNKYSEIRMGLMLAITQKKLDYSGLTFNDQLITGASVSSDALSAQQANYLDLGTGALFNSTNYWCGISIKHLNQPNPSMTGEIIAMPVYISMHGGYRYVLSARGAGKTKLEEFVSASFQDRREQNYDQFDIGAYYFKSLINFGVWYRGLPIKHYKPGYPNRECLSLLIGLELPDNNFRIGYSYDITISRLGINNTQGAHEISLVYEIAQKRKKNRRTLVSCPKF